MLVDVSLDTIKVRTVDDWRKARARGDTCAEFARSRSIPRPTLQTGSANSHGAHADRDGPEKPGSEAVLVPVLHASESSDHPTNLPFWTQDSGELEELYPAAEPQPGNQVRWQVSFVSPNPK
ncbi:hypothetical protein GQ600_7872 [Phytophthora cactorum]|nr:hypothetical protein GQ600_7872 [Phytophthora cactorum]